jgi:hypothetical protein
MKLIRKKEFETFKEGREEVLMGIPINTMAYIELSNCNSYEETFMKLNLHDISVKVEKTRNNAFIYSVEFISFNSMSLQQYFNIRNWDIPIDECVGISYKDRDDILRGN